MTGAMWVLTGIYALLIVYWFIESGIWLDAFRKVKRKVEQMSELSRLESLLTNQEKDLSDTYYKYVDELEQRYSDMGLLATDGKPFKWPFRMFYPISCWHNGEISTLHLDIAFRQTNIPALTRSLILKPIQSADEELDGQRFKELAAMMDQTLADLEKVVVPKYCGYLYNFMQYTSKLLSKPIVGLSDMCKLLHVYENPKQDQFIHREIEYDQILKWYRGKRIEASFPIIRCLGDYMVRFQKTSDKYVMDDYHLIMGPASFIKALRDFLHIVHVSYPPDLLEQVNEIDAKIMLDLHKSSKEGCDHACGD